MHRRSERGRALDAIEPDEIAERIGRPLEPAHDPVGPVHLHHDADLAEILYVAADPFPPADFWAAPGRGRLVQPGSAAGPVAVRVRVTEDAARVVEDPSEPPEPGDRDLVPPEGIRRSLRECRIGAGELAAWGAAEVAAYDAWRRGEVYGVVRETLGLSRGASGNADVQAQWLVLDLAGANSALAEAVERRESELCAAAAPRP